LKWRREEKWKGRKGNYTLPLFGGGGVLRGEEKENLFNPIKQGEGILEKKGGEEGIPSLFQ